MCRSRSISYWTAAVVLLLAAALPRLNPTAAAADAGGSPSIATELVQKALDAELAGDLGARKELLARALAVDPDNAAAHWHSGHVQFEGAWRTPDEIADMTATDPRWVEYRELRDSLADAPADHLTLAEWCRDHGLAGQERFHWANVLLAWPENEAARSYFGVQRYGGGLATREQVEHMEAQAEAAEDNLARFKPTMTLLCRDVIRGDEARRETALARLRATSEPAAIPAMLDAVGRAAEKSPSHAGELHLAVVGALASMPQHAATLQLLNYAVYSQHDEVRQLAAESLRPRPQTDYVPLLMAALAAPVELDVELLAAPDGSVRLLETARQPGPTVDHVHVRSTNYETINAINYDRSGSDPGVVLNRHLARAQNIAAATATHVNSVNAEVAARNEQIIAVLRTATSSDVGVDAQRWWSQWQEYNELASEPRQTTQTYEVQTEVYRYPEATTYYPSLGLRFEPYRPRSCFAPGTHVWMQDGPTAIENVVIGDFVLAQHPTTGEIGYRPVIGLTLGDPVETIDLRFDNETITATLGHRFWVNGAGWRMAKFLAAGVPLHALAGLREVTAVAPGEPVACYNLVVDDFHTYFVGKSRLLVHDLTCPQPAATAVPGSATLRPLDLAGAAELGFGLTRAAP